MTLLSEKELLQQVDKQLDEITRAVEGGEWVQAQNLASALVDLFVAVVSLEQASSALSGAER